MKKMDRNGSVLSINSRANTFQKIGPFKEKTIDNVFNFAWEMSFGGKGEHRKYRSGGIKRRKNGEIFSDTFQGKLAEFAVSNIFKITKIDPDLEHMPTLDLWDLGQWDKSDFNINGKKISVKSTKMIGQLLLLEKKDWTDKGEYIPNMGIENGVNDLFIMVRLDPPASKVLKENRVYYAQDEKDVTREKLRKIIMDEEWYFDVPSFFTRDQLIYAIQNDFVIKQGEYLNKRDKDHKMDADNYYMQLGDGLDPMTDLYGYIFS